MKYIRGIENYQNEHATAITLGKFDGLHLGHELLIERVIKHQEQDLVDGVVFAFDMKTPNALLTNEEKANRLEGRIDYFIDCTFAEKVANIEAESFIKDILVGIFHAKYIVVGPDFRFGHNRRGDVHMLEQYSQQYGYRLEVIEKKQYHGREISSTYIKEELQKGNMELVSTLLGYDYQKK